MIGNTVLVVTGARQTRRQIARALHSGGLKTHFLERLASLDASLQAQPVDLVVIDCDEPQLPDMEQALSALVAFKPSTPVVLLSTGADKTPLLELARARDVSNLIAKHGAVRAVFPMMDERELLVTCEKVLRRNIFGIDKYVGAWGVVCHTMVISSLKDKLTLVERFGEFLAGLDCPKSIIPAILTVADELIVNAVVHGPHLPDGTPKYEAMGPTPDLLLEPNEFVNVTYGCDGQRLMLSVSDNFGRLTKKTLYEYLVRNFGEKLEVEDRPDGAGLGLTMAFKNLHQMIINVQENTRTEAIAGWYLRVLSGSEFRQMAKSFNLFWLPPPNEVRENWHSAAVLIKGPATVASVKMRGQIDETTDFSEAAQAAELDLRSVNRITSRGVLVWLAFIGAMRGRGLKVRALPEPMVRMATDVAGILDGVTVTTVMVPFECVACAEEQEIELPVNEALVPSEQLCAHCGKTLKFAALPEHYATLARSSARP